MGDPSENDIDLMEAYLGGALPPHDRVAFEARLKSDKDFEMEFNSFRVSHQAIILQSRKEVKERLKMLDDKKDSRAKVINWKYISLAVAASISLIILVISLLSTPPTERLYNKYYAAYPNVVAPIERNEIADDPYKNAFQLYEDGQYQEALNLFNNLLQKNADSPELNLYAGLCALALKDPDTALAKFDNVIKTSPNDFAATASWYSALAYLQKGDKIQAISKLKSLEKNDFYRKRAEALKGDLE